MHALRPALRRSASISSSKAATLSSATSEAYARCWTPSRTSSRRYLPRVGPNGLLRPERRSTWYAYARPPESANPDERRARLVGPARTPGRCNGKRQSRSQVTYVGTSALLQSVCNYCIDVVLGTPNCHSRRTLVSGERVARLFILTALGSMLRSPRWLRYRSAQVATMLNIAYNCSLLMRPRVRAPANGTATTSSGSRSGLISSFCAKLSYQVHPLANGVGPLSA